MKMKTETMNEETIILTAETEDRWPIEGLHTDLIILDDSIWHATAEDRMASLGM